MKKATRLPAARGVVCGCLQRANHNRREVNRNGKHPKARKQLSAGGVHGLRPGGPPPASPSKRPSTRRKDSPPKPRKNGWRRRPPLFERQCKNQPLTVDKSVTLAEYTAYWLAHIAPRQAGKIHPGPGQAGHRPVPACPGRLQTHRPKTRTLPQSLRNLAEAKELCDRKTALREHH